MDLTQLQSKVSNKAYKSRDSFVTDMDLIVRNCLTYNGEDTCKSNFPTFCCLSKFEQNENEKTFQKK